MVVVHWTDTNGNVDPSGASSWFIELPVGEGVVFTNTGEFERLSERWYHDELHTFCHKCRSGVGVRVIPGAEAYLRKLISAWDHQLGDPPAYQ